MSVIAQAGAKGRQLHKFGGSSLVVSPTYISGEKRGELCPQKRTAGQ